MKNVLKVIGVGILIGTVLFVLHQAFRLVSGGEIIFNLRLLHSFLLYILYSIPLSFVNGYYFRYLNYRINWGDRHKLRFFISVSGSVILTLICIFLIRVIQRVGFNGLTYSEFIATESLQFYFVALIITMVVSLFIHAFEFYKIIQDKKFKEQKIIAGTASAKFESLKNQIDPHFLFNSLNVLTSLIEENPKQAEKFTTSLSKIYRYVLEQKNKELVSLEEELNFAKNYMDLLKMRFENSIFYEVPTALNNPEAKVVPLSLQLLLENTVKHNIVTAQKPLQIKIYEENANLVVENVLQKKESLGTRRGVGLENIVNRYRLVTKRLVSIEENENYFKVKLPILTKQISIMEIQGQTNEKAAHEVAYFRAKERVKEIKEFYGNLTSYCCVIPFLILINYITFWEVQWFWFPLFGWGLGVAIHGFSVFGYGRGWEERKIREIMQKEQQTKKTWE